MKKYIPFLSLFLFLATPSVAQVAINDNGAAPNSNAILDLDVTSNDKGLLIPRLSTAERTAMSLCATEEGLTVYDTGTKTYWLWDGTQWADFNTGQARHVGEVYSGGIIFFVDESGEHGMMASLDDLDGTAGAPWGLRGINVPNCESYTNGTTNTANIMTAGALATDAAGLCKNFSGGGHNDWYLPAIRELMMLLSYDVVIDYVLDNDGDPLTNGFYQEPSMLYSPYYWSSTEDANPNNALIFDFSLMNSRYEDKNNTFKVRCIRRF